MSIAVTAVTISSVCLFRYLVREISAPIRTRVRKMIVLRKTVARQSLRFKLQHKRRVSALYIPGDKASENYVTLQPYMDFESTLVAHEKQMEMSLSGRKMETKLSSILQNYKEYMENRAKLRDIEKERAEVVRILKSYTKVDVADAASNTLKEHGKSLRNDMKRLKEKLYPIEENFVESFLNLPNKLHRDCPLDGDKKLIFRSLVPRVDKADTHLLRTDLIRVVDDSRYYMIGEAADFDVQCSQAMFRHFLHAGGFLAMANPDFVRRVLLEANATPLKTYHAVMEENLQNKINGAYVTGGGAFESFLGAVTKLSVYPTVLPLRFVSCGRSYSRTQSEQEPDGASATPDLYAATQSNTVQTFVASANESEADRRMDEILNTAVDFYKLLGLHFRVVYVDASALTPAECLRADIEIYAPSHQRYISVGSVSHYTDFVSKRILFAMRRQKDFTFLHLVGGPVLHTTRLIAALLESGVSLKDVPLLGARSDSQQATKQKAMNQFKKVFK